MQDAETVIRTLALERHPEGGWYRETWRAESRGGRSAGTLIYFLLEKGQRSRWHRVDADELWLWHAGSGLELELAQDAGPVRTEQLGPDIAKGERPQVHVRAHEWQRAEAQKSFALVSCAVVPGFDFAGFELAPDGWEPGP